MSERHPAARHRALTGHDPARPHAAHRLGPKPGQRSRLQRAAAEVVGIVINLGMSMLVISPARVVDRVATLRAATPNRSGATAAAGRSLLAANADVFVAGSNSRGVISFCQARWTSR